jgi:hypothetical protein
MQVQRLLRARPQQKVEDTTKLRMLYSQLGRKLFCKKKKKNSLGKFLLFSSLTKFVVTVHPQECGLNNQVMFDRVNFQNFS